MVRNIRTRSTGINFGFMADIVARNGRTVGTTRVYPTRAAAIEAAGVAIIAAGDEVGTSR